MFFPHFIVPLHLLRKVIEVVEAVDGGAVDADDDVAAAESVFVGLAALAHQAYNWFTVDGNVGGMPPQLSLTSTMLFTA